MPTVIFAPPMSPPAAGTYAGEDGDVWVRTVGSPAGQQQRFNSAANGGPSWTIIVPRDYRADTFPLGGITNEVITKTSGNPYAARWGNPADSLVKEFDDQSPNATGIGTDEWTLVHGLDSLIVAVTVVEGDDEIVPDVEYLNVNQCRLHFSRPTDGIAVVRR